MSNKKKYKTVHVRGNMPQQSESSLVKSEIKLTIGMLVSNHIQYIRKAMEALKPLLEAVPSELVVADTKGTETDGSIAIVREYTDKIYPFTWCNDFSAARNVCMEHAKGEWFLYVDDDEWFDNVQEFIDFFQNGECEKYQSGYYYTRDYAADGTYSTGIAGRMIRRRENTRFVYKVHETFNEVHGPNKEFSVFTHHYGYAFQTSEEKRKHTERNISILKKELVTYGATPRLCAQMMQELFCADGAEEAAYSFGMDALQRLNREQLSDSCAQWMMVATVRCYSKQKKLAEAKKQAEYIKKNFHLNEITEMILAGTLANVAAAYWALEDMQKNAREYVRGWDWKQKHRGKVLDQVNLDMPNYCDDKYYHHMLLIGAIASNRLKQYEDAEFFWRRFPEDVVLKEEHQKERKKTQMKLQEKTLYPKLLKSDIKLTVGMLVSNHIQYIRKAMEALKPLLEAVPSELVVIDTMGDRSDGSIEVVREYTDKIYPFTWCNDFSAARNFCMEKSKGEWFLYVDDDEWFDDVTEFIEFFTSGECEEYYSGYYYTKDYLSDGTYSMGIAGRMIRRMTNTCFEGRVHETFNEVFAPNKEFSCFTHHYGYAYETEEDRARKQRRNLDILEKEIEEEGLTPRRAAQQVQELLSNVGTMEEGYRKCIEYLPKLVQQGNLMDSCTQWLLAARVRSLAERDMHDALVAEAWKVREEYTLTQTADMVIAVAVMFSAVEVNDSDLILTEADRYFSDYDWRMEHTEEALLQAQLDFPRFYAENYYHHIIRLAVMVSNNREEYERASRYWKRIPWKREGFDSTEYQMELNRTIEGLNRLKNQKMLTLQEAEQQRKNAKKKEWCLMLQTMSEALDYADHAICQVNYAELGELLSGMQEMAITVGQSMDEHFGEGTQEVSLLEEFCENVWRCSQAEYPESMRTYLETCRKLVNEVLEKLR